MIIANLKREENIIEYIIYMRQIQDILRANNLDINNVEKIIINNYDVPEVKKNEIRQWYKKLIAEMQEQEVESIGDLESVKHIINKLEVLNTKLLNDASEYKHKELYRWAHPYIIEYRKLAKLDDTVNDVETCINAVQSLLLLRLKKQPISDETAQAMQTFSNLLANLSVHWHSNDK